MERFLARLCGTSALQPLPVWEGDTTGHCFTQLVLSALPHALLAVLSACHWGHPLCSDEECMSLILRHIPSLQYFKLHSEGLENFLLWHRRVQTDQLPGASFLGTPWPWGNTAHLFI